MPKPPILALLLVCCPIVLMSVLAAQEQVGASPNTVARFPELKASNLAKRDFQLPTDFEGEKNLLLIAFEREQQIQLDTWLRQMKQYEDLDPSFRYYELPTIAKSTSVVRWFIDSGMRRGIPDQKARERTITLYLDKKPFCDSLKIEDEKHIYALLVDKTGLVLWRAEGVYNDVKGAELRRALQSR